MKKPDYPLDAPMKVHNPHGKALTFSHNGCEYKLPMGVSTWAFEIAERLERKLGALGVRITFARVADGEPIPVPEPEPVVTPVVPVVPEAETAPAPVAEPPADTPASTDVVPPAEPEPPVEPKE